MKILVINSGSSSIKYQIFDMQKNISLAKWILEKIWLKWSVLNYKINNKTFSKKKTINNHKDAINFILENLIKNQKSPIKDIKEIKIVWHRIVHWWDFFKESTIITKYVLNKIKKISNLAPLHNPANLEWIVSCKKAFKNIKQVAVFDTSFFNTIKEENYLYAIPKKYSKKNKIRKYWFHWISHWYSSKKACEILDLKYNKQKIITCHLWNWASISAIKNWKAIDTSMWMTPLSWLVMWTRCGDMDPSIPWIIKKDLKINLDEVYEILNKKSWLLWISWISNDMREILKNREFWNKNCELAIKVFINRIIKYIWSYIALMWWLDLLVFTWWMWENSAIIRKEIVEKLNFFWIKINNTKNEKHIWKEGIISDINSKVKIIVIEANEEYVIAKESFNKLWKNDK